LSRKSRLAPLLVVLLALAVLAASTSASASVPAPILSPAPGTPTAMPHSQISFLGAAAGSLSAISIVGSSSGHHSGHLRSYSSALGASFLPAKPFKPGEHVTVHAHWRDGAGHVSTLTTSFTVATPVPVAQTEFPSTPGTPADIQSFHSRPDLQPPAVTVHQAASSTSSPGDILATPYLGPGQYGPMIFNSSGELIWFHPVKPGESATDLRTQLFHEKNDLTWWQGRTLALGYGLGEDMIANANYKTVEVVKAGNGLQADEHEFDVTDNGSAWIEAYSPVKASTASAGGSAHTVVIEGVIQEIDIHTGLVMWEWHSLGHIAPSESYSKLPSTPTTPYDYLHLNSLTVDSHGKLLISGRNTWALYEISLRTGAVAWRLGGKHSSFKLGPGVEFAYQHNASWLPGGDISLFDDEGAPPVAPPSRGEIVKLNDKTQSATLAGTLVRSSGPLATASQGNVQALPGGNWMVGWGGLPNLTEFDSNGKIIYDAQLPAGEDSYRVYREPWSAQPSEPPALTDVISGATSTVYASWNGATTATSWQLLGGPSSKHLTAISTTPWRGFETTIPAPAAAFYQVRALSASGKVLGTSKVIPAGGS
jgi:hypothetical protein